MNNQENTNNLPAVVSVESLTETHGAQEAEAIYHRIAQTGGFGDFTAGDYRPPLITKTITEPVRIKAISELLIVKPAVTVITGSPAMRATNSENQGKS